MKKALPAIVFFVLFLFSRHPAVGQYSLNDRLIRAVSARDLPTIQSLLDSGAKIEFKDKNDETALMIAATLDEPEMVKLLLDNGANVEGADKNGTTPLLLAAMIGAVNPAKLLIGKGANIEATDQFGATPLIQAACSIFAPSRQRSEIATLLLEKGANSEVEDKMGHTPLKCANEKGPAELVDLLEAAHKRQRPLEEAKSLAPKERLAYYARLLQSSPQNDSLREKIFQLTATLPEPQPIPEAARQLFVAATDQIKQAGTPAALDQPIALLRKALEIAPWWSNAYYNLSRALEMRGQYDDAARQLNYYLELKPAEADAIEVRAHLVVLQAEKDAAAKQ